VRLLVLVLGAGGQLGEAIAEGLARRHEVVARTHAELDVTRADAVRSAITSICPDIIINCAADTDVDGSEDDPSRALAVNALAPRTIARAAIEIDATLVHYSTDFVFDGTATAPYGEEDAPNPRGVYAVSKLLGEWFAAAVPRHYVLRVESLFGGRLKSSIDQLLDNMLAGREVRAFVDRTVSPSYVDDVVRATQTLLENAGAHGLYHCVNTGWTTWLGLARELATLAHCPSAAIASIEMRASGLRAPRPRFSALSNAKLARASIPMPTWQDALARYVASVLSRRQVAMGGP
jgi:dTDP-4-dehydrorhamnose reductase